MTSTAATDRLRIATIPRLLSGGGPGYDEHLRGFGPLRLSSDLIGEVERSGLTGRGGAAFPTARKMAAMGPRGVVIGNGSEGEPLSRKDELLLRIRPHLVIDGLLATAAAVRANRLHLVVRPSCVSVVRRALAERNDARTIEVTVAEDRFVGGEASAVVNLLAGRGAIPVDHTVRLTTRGLGRRSTLVQNVETLAHVALIARFGAARFREVGHPADPGTRLFSIAGDVARPGVTEAVGGATLRSVLSVASPKPVAAVLLGGYHGTWVGADALDRTLSTPAVDGAVAIGPGIILSLGASACGVRTTSEIAEYLAGQSAGQCGPCVNGLPAVAQLLGRIARGDHDPSLPTRVEQMLALVDGRGACHHPDGTARMVRSAMRVFARDIEAHRHGWCEASE